MEASAGTEAVTSMGAQNAMDAGSRQDREHAEAAEVVAAHERECRAMVDGNVAVLGSLLAEDFALTHMTGYRQPREEWLHDVETGRMRYHSMVDARVDARVDGDVALLDARTRTEATIWGGHGVWRLRLRTRFERTPDGWIAQETVASTW